MTKREDRFIDRQSSAKGVDEGLCANTPSISVVIPAFNEEAYLGETLDRLRAAERFLTARTDSALQILVVDNGSSDRTVEIARDRGATVVTESERNIARVRNTGAQAADHDVLVFLDADTLVPPDLLLRIAQAMREPACAGGAPDAVYHPARFVMRVYLGFWRVIGLVAGMAMGACQFCRRDIFGALGGYDETWFMGEDVDFIWRLRAFARRRGLQTCSLRDVQVVPSSRRWDKWPVWRTLVLTNPFLMLVLRRRRSSWNGWYDQAPR